MNFCWLIIPVLLFGVFFHFFAAKTVKVDEMQDQGLVIVFVIVSALLSLPGILITSYELHLFDDWGYYYEMRAWPFIEFTCAFMGLFTGCVSGLVKRFASLVNMVTLTLLVVLLILPFAWSFGSLVRLSELDGKWDNDICLRSSEATSDAAAAATIMRYFHVPGRERYLAKECFTYAGGVHLWYLDRAFGRRNLNVEYSVGVKDLNAVSYPCLARVVMDGNEHVIPLLSLRNGVINVGDPVTGRAFMSIEDFSEKYEFTGFVMAINNKT